MTAGRYIFKPFNDISYIFILTILALYVRLGHSAEAIQDSYKVMLTCRLAGHKPATQISASVIGCMSVCSKMETQCTALSVTTEKVCMMYTVSLGDMQNTTACPDEAIEKSAQSLYKIPRCRHDGVWNSKLHRCDCFDGYIGISCERIMVDCNEGALSGLYLFDVDYTILNQPREDLPPVRVQCRMQDDAGIIKSGTLIMKNIRTDQPVFNVTWQAFKDGFGDVMSSNGIYWIGLDYLSALTSLETTYKVSTRLIAKARFEQFENRTITQGYTGILVDVRVSDESDGYRLYYSKANQEDTSPDCFAGLNGVAFSTYDKDMDDDEEENCAAKHGAGFWYSTCTPTTNCSLTGWIHFGATEGILSEAVWNPEPEHMDLTIVHLRLRSYVQI